ncbi:hypothetical protein [Actinophytocola glycyrrhizae]|uniref:Uncharacterized protein n=1 Tax=Actinophytocola glycyrrhizae TaxID=2044873 RepID=A0ABV9S1I4_9PSEU
MASWNHDGTQDPGPPPLMSDPLSGQVTGGKHEAEAVRVRVVEPSMPDIEQVREAMASVLDEDSELMMGMPAAATRPAPAGDRGANDPDAGDGGEGVGAVAAAPAPAPAPPPPTPPAGIPAATLSAGRIPLQRVRPPRPIRRGTFSPGIAAIGLLLLVIGVLVIVMLANLIDTISSLFS